MAELTPMMKQYFEIKKRYIDCIIFFRLGDFYEMFFDDAKVASRELELTLTGRDCGQEERAPMCGVPFHSYETYAARLVAKGYKIAICEQVEDPETAQGLVRRDVIRVITPGTVIEGSMLDEGRNNYLCAICCDEESHTAGLCFTDCSTGEIYVTELSGNDLSRRICNELGRYNPTEVLTGEGAEKDGEVMAFIRNRLSSSLLVPCFQMFEPALCCEKVLSHFQKSSLEELGLASYPCAMRALGCALLYLYSTQMNGLNRLTSINMYSDVQFMRLDVPALRNLELLETMRGREKRGSLLGVLDKTKTAMGKRLIRSWIEQPLINPAHISRRHGAVQELVGNTVLRGDLTELLSEVYDLERIMTRIVYGSANAKELRSLSQTIHAIGPIRQKISSCTSSLLQELYKNTDDLTDVMELIDRSIVDDPPFSVREGGMIRPGYHAEIDELREEMTDGKNIITRVETQEKERTGIKNLKVGYNRVFGYYIEISKAYDGEVPEHYIRKQTLANAERYITQELKELEARVLGAKDRIVVLEYQLFNEIRLAIAEQLSRIQNTAKSIASLDVLCSFAQVAVRRHYTCPTVDKSSRIHIVGGRHPVVEALSDKPFVPNDTLLDDSENRILMITGPNMAGKSTYMRQTALIVLMAQIGSFVPAEKADIGIVDSIYTRVGASDDLASGQSTFMVEMSEVASILHTATKNSLIIFDEIGRGTSTFDGMSIARSVLEFVADTRRIGAKTLFATHYHELTVMEEEMDCVKNYSVAVKKRGEDITFLRRIVRGPADGSYGIEVANLAGVPDKVVSRAKEILSSIESGEMAAQAAIPVRRREAEEESQQLTLLGTADTNPLLQKLKQMDVNTLTPIEALQVLYDLCKEAEAY